MATREWKKIEDFDFKEILFEEYNGIAKITINRPRYRNAFTPRTTWEMSQAFAWCREAQRIGVVILTGAGDKAFCSGGDMNVKGRGGYVGDDGVPRLNVLDVQKQIRSLPKPVIAMVNGYAIGGGHVLHLMCDKVVPFDRLEDECVEWAETMMERSPLALRMIKAGLNAELDGQAGIQELAGDATMLYYMLDEAQEGGRAFLEKRKPNFKKYPKLP